MQQIFSHIYIEKQILSNKYTKNILSHFPKSKVIIIEHYKDVFCRNGQDFFMQKQAPSLILASKNNNLIYKGANVCQDFGNEHFYYTSCVMNCIYDCEYCYLQGMYSCANIVVFVNLEDIFDEVEKLLKKHSVYLCISYDTDLLALENILGYTKAWIKFAKKHSNLKIEIRTKSANFNAIKDIKSSENIILAWTLSPEIIINSCEHNTPSLENRLKNIRQALNNNWYVRLCFDPLIYDKDWKNIYSNFIKQTFSYLSTNNNKIPQSYPQNNAQIVDNFIKDVSIGVFRISNEYLKNMRKQRKNSIIVNYPFENDNGVFHYGSKLSNEMINYIYNLVLNYISSDKIFVWKEN